MELKIENEKLILDTSFTMKDYIETKVFLIEDLYKKNKELEEQLNTLKQAVIKLAVFIDDSKFM